MKDKIILPFYLRLTCVLISLCLMTYISIVGQSILVPLVIGFLVAMLLLPVSNFFERKLRFPRIITSLISPILFVLLIVGVGYFLGTQIAHFKDDLPAFQQQLTTLFHNVQDFVYEHFGVKQSEQLEYLTENAEKTVKASTGFVGNALLSISSTLMSSTFVFLYIFFILLYRSHLVKFIKACFGQSNEATVMKIVNDIQKIIKQYLIGLMIQVVIVTTLMYIAYLIIGIKYAFLLAALAGILNLIPYLGIFTATSIAAIVTLATGEPIDALFAIIAVIVVNSIDGNIITPKIIGSQVQVNSFLVLFGIIVGESIWGISGMFLAIPLLAISKIIFDNVNDLKPYGFLLGEEGAPVPFFKNTYDRYLYGIKSPEDLPEDLQTEEQNHQEFDEKNQIDTDKKNDDSKDS